MLLYAVVSFAIAAVGGLLLATYVLGGKAAPWGLSLLHGALGAIGLVLVLLAIVQGDGQGAIAALAVLVFAALGGFYLASLHLRNEIAPKGAVIAHAGVAVIGFLLLCNVVFSFL